MQAITCCMHCLACMSVFFLSCSQRRQAAVLSQNGKI